MTGKRSGGLQAAATNKREYGKDFYSRIGALGGKASSTGGFYKNRELASAAGRIGGLRSRIGKPPVDLESKLYKKILANLERVQEESRKKRYEI